MIKELIEARVKTLQAEHQKAIQIMQQARDRAVQIEGALAELQQLLKGESDATDGPGPEGHAQGDAGGKPCELPKP